MKKSPFNNTIVQVEEYETKSNKKVLLQSIESIGSAVLYGLCSTSMAFTNKAIITSYNFHFPFFIMACQMILCIIFLEVLRVTNVINIQKYSLKLGRSFTWPTVFYTLHSVTSLYALGGMSIPMYTAIKRCAPIVTLILSVIVLKKKYPNARIISSVILISVGCIVASLGDLEFDSTAYRYGAISILAQGLYLTLAQKCLESMSALQVLYISSYNATPFYAFVCLLMETQAIAQFDKFSDLGFILCFGIQVSVGVLLNYSLFLCTEKNSALTTSLVGVLKSIMQTVIGFFTFGGVKVNILNICGISLNTIGGILYSYSKYREKLKSTQMQI